MSSYISGSGGACGSPKIETTYGDVIVRGGPLYPSVSMPVSDQFFIDKFCEARPEYSTNYPGGCSNFIRNNNLVNFVTGQKDVFGPFYTPKIIEKLGVCKSEELKAYMDWRSTQSKSLDNSQLPVIANVCGITPPTTNAPKKA